MKLLLLVSALLIADARLLHAQTAAPSDQTRRNIDQALVYAKAADSLCGTDYLKNVIANIQQDGVALDDIMRVDRQQIDERAMRLIAANADNDHKDKFCDKIKRDAASKPDE